MSDDDSWKRAIAAYGAPPPPRGIPTMHDYVNLVLPDHGPTVRREAAVAERARIVADLRAIADDVTNPTNKLALLMVALWIEHE